MQESLLLVTVQPIKVMQHINEVVKLEYWCIAA